MSIAALLVSLWTFRDAKNLQGGSSVATQESPVSEASKAETSENMRLTEVGLRNLSDELVRVAAKARPSVVSVFTERVYRQRVVSPFDSFFFDDFFGPFFERPKPRERQYRQSGLGSGVIVRADGTILTNNHVIDGATSISVGLWDGQVLKASVLGKDPKTDIAVIRVDAKLSPIELGKSATLEVGEIVIAVGSPMNAGLAHTVTQGIVSAVGRSNVGLAEYEDFIQTDAAINPGNSGGALVNLSSELIGINTAIASVSGGSQGIGFAVPIDMAALVMESLITQGRVVRGYMGAQFQNLNQPLAEALGLSSTQGALVVEVYPRSPADRAGLQRGDVLVELNGEAIKNAVIAKNRIATSLPGAGVSMEILRDGRKLKIRLTLEDLPAPEKPRRDVQP